MGQNAKGKDGKQKGDGDTFEDPALVRAAEEKAKAAEEHKAKEQKALICSKAADGSRFLQEA